jgi:hypothetical protein
MSFLNGFGRFEFRLHNGANKSIIQRVFFNTSDVDLAIHLKCILDKICENKKAILVAPKKSKRT